MEEQHVEGGVRLWFGFGVWEAARKREEGAMAEAAHLVAQYLEEEGCMRALDAFRMEKDVMRRATVRVRRRRGRAKVEAS